jgi:phosphopantetheine--protein transferase-like protein
MKRKGLGIDIVEVKRFASLEKAENNRFLANNFNQKELNYCLAFKDAATHLAGTFAAKEAVFKALGQKDLAMSLIEIRRGKTGQPTVWIKNKKQASILVSISHTTKVAMAVAIKV